MFRASPSAQSACSTEKKAQSVAASEDRASRKRSNNDEESQVGNLLITGKKLFKMSFLPNFNSFYLQNQLNEEATELHPTVNKKSKIENGLFSNA